MFLFFNMPIKDTLKYSTRNINLKLKSKIGLLGELIRLFRVYLILLSVVMITSTIFFSHFGSSNPGYDNTNMLSNLVQGEVAMFAIVISLSLVAVELSASSYSVRLIDIFKKSPDFLILVETYLIAIIYGLMLLNLNKSLPNLDAYILSAYCLGIFAFVSLGPYFWNTLNLLKPSTAINILAEKVTKEDILSSIRDGHKKYDDKDPIQPITDIIRSSLMKYDYETARFGLEAFGRCIDRICDSEVNDTDFEKIIIRFFTHVRRAGNVAARRNIGDSSLLATIILNKCWEKSLKRPNKNTVWCAAFSFYVVGTRVAKEGLDIIALQAIESLEQIGETAVMQRFEDAAWWVVYSIGCIGESTAEQKGEAVVVKAVKSLENVGRIAAEHEKCKYVT